MDKRQAQILLTIVDHMCEMQHHITELLRFGEDYVYKNDHDIDTMISNCFVKVSAGIQLAVKYKALEMKGLQEKPMEDLVYEAGQDIIDMLNKGNGY